MFMESMETPVNAPFNEKVKIEIAKLRKMNFKTKMEYIWEYYKLLLIGLVIVLIIIGSLINIWFINPPPDTALFISWNTGFIYDEQLEDLTDTLNNRLIDEKENATVVISLMITSDVDPTFAMANTQRLVAMVAAGQIDIFILDSTILKEYAENGIIQPLDTVLAGVRSIDPVAYGKIEENLVYAMYESEEGVSGNRIMGVDISNNPLLADQVFSDQEFILCLSVTAANIANVEKTLVAFYD